MEIDNIENVHIFVAGSGKAGRNAFKEVLQNVKISNAQIVNKDKEGNVFETTSSVSMNINMDCNQVEKMQISEKIKENLTRIGFTKQDFEEIFTEEDLLNKMAEKWYEQCKGNYNPYKLKKKKSWKKNKFWE